MISKINQSDLELISGSAGLDDILSMPAIDNIAGAVYGAAMGAFVGGVGGGLAGSYVGGGIFGVVGGSLGYLSTTVVGAISGLINGFFVGYKEMQTLLPAEAVWESLARMMAKDGSNANPIIKG